MRSSIRFLAILIISFIIIVFPSITYALNNQQIDQIGRDITVVIDGCNSGSGVIYERQENTYYVLTAQHNFEDSTVGCLAITPDGKRYEIESNKIITPLPGIDLAVFSFISDIEYQKAIFGGSENINTNIYIAGAPEPSQAIPQRTIVVTSGNIAGRQQPQEGYELIYDSPTRRGMSGGAILNQQGQVIGIHGQGDREEGNKTGFNLGIPIRPLA